MGKKVVYEDEKIIIEELTDEEKKRFSEVREKVLEKYERRKLPEMIFSLLDALDGRFNYEDGLTIKELAERVYGSPSRRTRKKTYVLIDRARKWVEGIFDWRIVGEKREGEMKRFYIKADDKERCAFDITIIRGLVLEGEETEMDIGVFWAEFR